MKVLLFDLDGTLLDSGPDLAASVNAARDSLGLPPLTIEAVLPHVGWGLTHLLKHTLPASESIATAREVFHDYYRGHAYDRSRPYPGAEAALTAWSGRVALVTNKPRPYVDVILEATGWSRLFAASVCGDEVRKPDPEALRRALRALGASASDALFVGDTEVDLETAEAAGVPFAAVPWGRVEFPRRVTLEALAVG